MSRVEQTVTALRRGHLALVVTGILLLLLALPQADAYAPAIQEVRTVRALLGTGGVESICGEAAESRFDSYWASVMDAVEGRGDVRLGEDVRVSFTGHCPHPSVQRRMADIRDFMETGLWVDFPTPLDTAIANLIVRNGDLGVLERAHVQWATTVSDTLAERVILAPLTDTQLREINAGTDSIEVMLTFVEETLAGPADTVDTLGQDTMTSPSVQDTARVAGASVSARLPGTVYQELLPAEVFLGEDSRWETLLGEPSADLPAPIFPELRRYWYEVERLSPAEAQIRLEDRAVVRETTGELLGLRIDLETLGLVGPVLLLTFLLQLTLHVGHLERVTEEGEASVIDHPWSPLYGRPLATAAAWVSIVLLPAAALAVLTYRLQAHDGALTAVAAVLGVGCLALGVWVLETLRRLVRSAPE